MKNTLLLIAISLLGFHLYSQSEILMVDDLSSLVPDAFKGQIEVHVTPDGVLLTAGAFPEKVRKMSIGMSIFDKEEKAHEVKRVLLHEGETVLIPNEDVANLAQQLGVKTNQRNQVEIQNLVDPGWRYIWWDHFKQSMINPDGWQMASYSNFKLTLVNSTMKFSSFSVNYNNGSNSVNCDECSSLTNFFFAEIDHPCGLQLIKNFFTWRIELPDYSGPWELSQSYSYECY